MLQSATLNAFLATSDPARAKVFFQDVLGLKFVNEGSHALVFDANGVSIWVQKVEQVVAAPYTALGWTVADIHATVRGLVSRGVTFERYGYFEQDADGVWKAPGGAQVAWFRDPDGHVLSLTQMP